MGFFADTAIQDEEPRDVYTLPSSVLRAPRAMQELSTPPHATRTELGRPRAEAASFVRVPRIRVEGTISGKISAAIPLPRISS
jgi:hypothetical protein